jgi:hypothetical protein
VPIEQRPPQSSSLNSDFCFRNDTINLESPLADELFLNGKVVVPIEIKKIIPPLHMHKNNLQYVYLHRYVLMLP